LTRGTFGFFEVHIEQGPVLEAAGCGLGVVTAICGQTRLNLTFRGQANHAGTTPMRYRSDALMAAAQWMVSVETLARETAGLVATVGVVTVRPGAVNIIPGEVVVSLDVRHAEDKVRVAAARRLVSKAESIARYRSLAVAGTAVVREVRVSVEQTSVQRSVAMDGGLVAALGPGLPRMASGAGHDAMIVAERVPAVMLFLRSPGGLSHHPAEAVLEEDVADGLRVGVEFLRGLASG
jgi:allantoate deiminase